MDALKGCTSNVHILKDIDTTRYRLYVCQEPASSHAQRIANTITQLRAENVICAATKDRIWIFDGAEEEAADRPFHGFHLKSQGTIAEHNEPSMPTEGSITSTFIDALEGSITFALSRAHNAIRLSAWTWLLPDLEMQNHDIEARMQIQLADDGKRLSIATIIRTSELIGITPTHASGFSKIIVAPSGMPATLPAKESGSAGRVKVENITFARGNEQWKALVCEALATYDIILSPDAPWIDVVLSGSKKVVHWPNALCFTQRKNITLDTLSECCVNDWRSWFELPDTGAYDDPLSFAEDWITTFADREMQQYVPEAIRHEASTMNDISTAQAQIDSTTFDVTSPPLTNRPDLQALHGIYPTPPDGLAVHGVPQLQPQSENPAASSGDPVQTSNFTPSDPALENHVPLFDGVPDVDGEQAQRNHSIVSSIGPHAQDWNRGSTDDLFGDMDDMEYGREEVGDADFNFFDEPDAEPMKNNAEVRFATALDAISGHGVVLDDLQHNDMLHNPTESSDAQTSAEPPENQSPMHTEEVEHASPDPPTGHDDGTYAAPIHQEEQSTSGLYNVKAQRSDEVKPLSPFGIKEALLPPPIPASASHSHASMASERRRSSFGPLVFNSGNTFAHQSSIKGYSDFRPDERKASYDLGPTRVPLTAISESSASVDTPSSLDDAESGKGMETDDENDVSSIASEHQHVADTWDEERTDLTTRKRKRTLDTSSYCGPQSTTTQLGSREQHAGRQSSSNGLQADQMHDLIVELLSSDGSTSSSMLQGPGPEFGPGTYDAAEQQVRGFGQQNSNVVLPLDPQGSKDPTANACASSTSVLQMFPGLKLGDLVFLGQIVAEQAVTIVRRLALEFAASGNATIDKTEENLAAFQSLDATLESIASTLTICDISSLALVREPLPIQRPQANQANASIASQARQPPRPPPRVDHTALGPDILPLTASFVRANRSESSWEMAPTALAFWEALGLSPASGSKDIRHFCIAPDNTALEDPVADFLRNLKAAYEGCKFGSMAVGVDNGNTSPREDVDYLHPVTFESPAIPSFATAMQAYWNACSILGSELAEIAFDEPCRTLLVSMISPFQSATDAEWATTTQHFGACFLNLWRSYHNTASRDKRFNGKEPSQRQISDIDFKIVPIDLVASPASLVVPTAQQMALLAREMYDRCPPSSDIANESSPLSNAAAPSVELVAPLPKRISFQLTSDPPADLLHEASILHVAFATSKDGKWTNVIWHDNTGRYANASALCMQGRSFANIALEVWKRTMELIKAREVIWRIFIVTAGGDGVETSRANCWKDIISQHTERKQLLSVTLLHFQPDLALSITHPSDSAPIPGSGAPTPAATPQPGSGQAISITSPEAINAGNAPVTAPPTPAPSEAASSILEADPDAHLIETEDETWGMLIDRDLASTLRPSKSWPERIVERPDHITALSYGVLIKRGKIGNAISSFAAERPFPCAGASLLWTLRVRPKSDRQGVGERPNVDEGSSRHAEVMLREVLGMFRNLGLLSKVKGLDPSGLVPVHVIAAMKGAEGLNGLLGEQVRVEIG